MHDLVRENVARAFERAALATGGASEKMTAAALFIVLGESRLLLDLFAALVESGRVDLDDDETQLVTEISTNVDNLKQEVEGLKPN